MDEAENDRLAFTARPPPLSTKLHTANPLERINCEITRRTDAVEIIPNETTVARNVGTLIHE